MSDDTTPIEERRALVHQIAQQVLDLCRAYARDGGRRGDHARGVTSMAQRLRPRHWRDTRTVTAGTGRRGSGQRQEILRGRERPIQRSSITSAARTTYRWRDYPAKTTSPLKCWTSRAATAMRRRRVGERRLPAYADLCACAGKVAISRSPENWRPDHRQDHAEGQVDLRRVRGRVEQERRAAARRRPRLRDGATPIFRPHSTRPRTVCAPSSRVKRRDELDMRHLRTVRDIAAISQAIHRKRDKRDAGRRDVFPAPGCLRLLSVMARQHPGSCSQTERFPARISCQWGRTCAHIICHCACHIVPCSPTEECAHNSCQ